MLIRPSFKKSLIVEQFQGNYLKGGWTVNVATPVTPNAGSVRPPLDLVVLRIGKHSVEQVFKAKRIA